MTSPASDRAPARIYITDEAADPPARAVFAAIRARGGKPVTMHRALAGAPDIMTAVYDLAITLRSKTSISRSIAELMILRTTQLEGSQYEFAAHKQLGLKVGLTQAQIDALDNWHGSSVFTPEQRAVLAHADALAARSRVPDDVFDGLRSHFSDPQIVELTWSAAFYVAATRFSAAMDMQVEH